MKKNIRDFLNSDMIESDFYNLPKEDLICLRDYLLQFKAKDVEFMNLIKEPLSLMKEKCSWIDDVAFSALQIESTGKYFNSSVWLFPTKGNNLIVSTDKENDVFKDITEKIYGIYLLNNNIRMQVKRQKELKMIQEELHEIDKIGRTYYDGLLYSQKSVSGYFDVSYTPNIGMHVWSDDELLAEYLVRKMKVYDRPYLKEEDKDKVLSRIQIKKR